MRSERSPALTLAVAFAVTLGACAGSDGGGESAHPAASSTTAAASGVTACTPHVDRVRSDLPRIPPSDDPQLHRHTDTARISAPLAARQRAELARAVATARQLATVADAIGAGYVPTGGSSGDGEGVHFTNWSLVNCHFDAAHPSQLLYDGSTPDAPLVAFSYYLVSSGHPPGGFAGRADRWHRHFGICVRNGAMLDRLQPQGHETLASCQAQGGQVLDGRDLWMLHAWVVPGWPNRQGLFAPLNPRLIRQR